MSEMVPWARDWKPGAYRGAGRPLGCWFSVRGGSSEVEEVTAGAMLGRRGFEVYVGASETYEGAAERIEMASGS